MAQRSLQERLEKLEAVFPFLFRFLFPLPLLPVCFLFSLFSIGRFPACFNLRNPPAPWGHQAVE